MTKEEWDDLDYEGRKAALTDSAYLEEPLDLDYAKDLEPFFDESPEMEVRVRKFLDISMIDLGSCGLLSPYLRSDGESESENICAGLLRELQSDPETEDYDRDLGMDSYQFSEFRERLLDKLRISLFQGEDSSELELLNSLGAIYVEKVTMYIESVDGDGDWISLNLTLNSFSDGRPAEIVYPWEGPEAHGRLCEYGEWLELDGEEVAYKTVDELIADYRADVIAEADRDLDRELDEAFGAEFELPSPDDSEEQGPVRFGDSIVEGE
jgi:hypothetical protein